MRPFSVLAVDDDPVQLEVISVAARKLEYPPIEVATAAAALSAGCRRLLSEDLHGGQMIANLEIVNSFA